MSMFPNPYREPYSSVDHVDRSRPLDSTPTTLEQRRAYLQAWRKAHPDNISKHRENEAVKRLRAAGYTVIPPQAGNGTNEGRGK